MNFDAIGYDQLRNRRSNKWGLHPDCIGMFVAEMDFGIAPAIRDVLTEFANGTGIGYLPEAGKRDIREAAAGWVSRHGGWSVGPEQVIIFPDVITAARVAIQDLTEPGSAVVVPTPTYMAFLQVFEADGREVIQVPSAIVDGRYELDLAGIERAFADGAGSLILVNPWNPTGRVLTRPELAALDAVMAKFPQARVISDDIHAPLALEAEWIPYASISANAARQSITTIAASKGWNIPGLKSAQMIVSNPQDLPRLEAARVRYEKATGSLGCSASVAAYNDSADWIAEVSTYIRGNLDLVTEWAEQTPGVTMLRPDGTYIAWLDFSGARESGVIPAQEPIDQWIRDNAKVALTAGGASGRGFENFARMITATPRPVLRDALDAIGEALGN